MALFLAIIALLCAFYVFFNFLNGLIVMKKTVVSLLFILSFLTVGCNTVTNNSSAYVGEKHTVFVDTNDNVTFSYLGTSKCFDRCGYDVNYPHIQRTSFDGNSYTVFNVIAERRDGGDPSSETIVYKLKYEEETKDGGKNVSLSAYEKNVKTFESLISPLLGNVSNPHNIEDLLSRPSVINVKFNDVGDFISPYNQESVVGNIARFGYLNTNYVQKVHNDYELKFDYPEASVKLIIKTFAYRNGSRVIIDEFNLYPKKDIGYLDAKSIKKLVLDKLDKMIKD